MKKDSFSGFANDLKIFHPQQVFRTFQPMCFPCFKQKPEQHIVSLPRLKMVRSLKELLGRWFLTFLGGRGSVKVQFVMKERFNKKATEIFWGSHFENPHNPNKKLQTFNKNPTLISSKCEFFSCKVLTCLGSLSLKGEISFDEFVHFLFPPVNRASERSLSIELLPAFQVNLSSGVFSFSEADAGMGMQLDDGWMFSSHFLMQ